MSRPSKSIPIRPLRPVTRNADAMSWETTMLVTPSFSCSRSIWRSMIAVVTGSRPVVGSS
jgi:hypothetical protein